MKKQLIALITLICLALFPAIGSGVELEDGKTMVMKSSNAEAWKMLEDGTPPSYQAPYCAPQTPSNDNEWADPSSPFGSDESAPASSLPPQIPEPTTIILLGMGLIGLGARHKLRK